MSDTSESDRFFKRASEFYYALARKRNLGIALGRWDHPRFGAMRVIAVYGWVGRLYVTLACCATDAALANEQVRLWWYLADRTEHFELKHVATRRPMSQWTVRGTLAMGKEILKNLKWLEGLSSVEEAFKEQFDRNFGSEAVLEQALNDPDNELPTEGYPEEDP
jgi:hypothetical protein